MKAVITTFLDELTAAGVSGITYCDLAGGVGPFGEWGSMDYVGEPSTLTPKYNALVAFTSLGISGPSIPTPVPAGTQEQFTVTVYEPNGSTVDTSFTGTVQFGSSDPQAVLPAKYTFTSADQGVHTFNVTLKTAGTQWISATDLADGSVVTQSGIVIQPAPPVQSLAIIGVPSVVHAGVTTSFEIAAVDAYGNVIPGYTGTIQITCSDPAVSLPSSYTFTPADAGIHTFSAQFESLGTQTITAADTTTPSIQGSASTTVSSTIATRDTSTQGNWIGTYGSQGYYLFPNQRSSPLLCHRDRHRG